MRKAEFDAVVVFVAERVLDVLKTLDSAFFTFFTGRSAVSRRSRIAFRDHLAGIEKMTLKAVIARILLRRRAAVAFDNEIFVADIVIVHIVPAKGVQIDLRDAFSEW